VFRLEAGGQVGKGTDLGLGENDYYSWLRLTDLNRTFTLELQGIVSREV
jgi:hypothetical protein